MMTATVLPKCPYTGSSTVEVIYDGPIRSGGADSGFEDGYRVLLCRESGLAWLDPLPPGLDACYGTDSYWFDHHQGNPSIDQLRKKLDHEQLIWLNKTGTDIFRGKVVADFGCGAGIFFDFIKGISARRVGIDLSETYAQHLVAEGHEFVKYSSNIQPNWADVGISFDTLEHVPKPWEFLRIIRKTLKPCGSVFIGVPNRNDFLKDMAPAYLKFFYHKSHLWYFDETSLARLLRDAGFDVVKSQSVHKYDLNNLVVWLRENRGIGKGSGSVFDVYTDDAFIRNVERQGRGSHILIKAIVAGQCH